MQKDLEAIMVDARVTEIMDILDDLDNVLRYDMRRTSGEYVVEELKKAVAQAQQLIADIEGK